MANEARLADQDIRGLSTVDHAKGTFDGMVGDGCVSGSITDYIKGPRSMGFRPYLNLSQIISNYLIFASNVQKDAKKCKKMQKDAKRCKMQKSAKTCKNTNNATNAKNATKCKNMQQSTKNAPTKVQKQCKNTRHKCKQGQTHARTYNMHSKCVSLNFIMMILFIVASVSRKSS